MSTVWLFIIINLSILIIAATVYIIRNLTIKVEKAEVVIKKQDEYLLNLYELIMMSEKRIKEIDLAQTFQSDDEIGFFFTNIKTIQSELSDYIKHVK